MPPEIPRRSDASQVQAFQICPKVCVFFFKSDFRSFSFLSTNVLKTNLKKKSRICPIRGQSDPLWRQMWYPCMRLSHVWFLHCSASSQGRLGWLESSFINSVLKAFTYVWSYHITLFLHFFLSSLLKFLSFYRTYDSFLVFTKSVSGRPLFNQSINLLIRNKIDTKLCYLKK